MLQVVRHPSLAYLPLEASYLELREVQVASSYQGLLEVPAASSYQEHLGDQEV